MSILPRRFRVAAIVVAAVMIAIGFLPLFGGPGYEHALATGLVVPVAAAILAALDVVREKRTPLGAIGRGVHGGLLLAAIALLTAMLHALRVGICEVKGALLYFALTAGIGSMMGGAWGAVAGGIASLAKKPRRWAILLAIAGPLGGALLSVYRFYSSPMVFAYDPFVGYFSGTLYDTVIDAGTALLTYRLGSLATLIGLSLAASAVRFEDRRPHLASGVRALLAGVALVASLGVTIAGTALGHASTAGSIAEDLGGAKHGARCDVVYPSTTREQEANLLVKDCDEELAAVEKVLGARGPERVRAFFFRDADDKKRLMGAGRTYIAKPWRHEVYLQLGGYPHPVLAHELSHVVAGSFGRGPFRIAGSLGGVVPNPGLIEGVAVFAAGSDDDLTDAEWARAMMDLGILPSMRRVFSFSFLGDSSEKSYTLAGAFIGHIAKTYGVETVRRWYAGEDIALLTKRDWAALDADFRAALAKEPLPPEAESFAKARFNRPGLFGRKCPHLVDALRSKGDQCRASARYTEAVRLYAEAMAKDPLDFASREAKAEVERRQLDAHEGGVALAALVTNTDVPRVYRDRAEEALADAELIDGAYASAAARYDSLARRTVDEDAARNFEIKAIGARDEAARPAVLALLIGDRKHGPDAFLGAVELGVWSRSVSSGLAHYLIGRNLIQRGFYEAGAAALDRAIEEGTPTRRVARETLRVRASAACALSDGAALVRLKDEIESSADPFAGSQGGRREGVLRMIARCSR